MKHLNSTTQELRKLFDENLTVKHIAEFSLVFASHDEDDLEVQRRMQELDFDVMLIRSGPTFGYIEREKLVAGPCDQQLFPVTSTCLIAESTPILELFHLLSLCTWKFVLVGGEIGGIVSRGDLRKAPVRMFLFSQVNLLEIQLTRVITRYRPGEAWKVDLNPNRLEKAKSLMKERARHNEALDLLDCTQFSDKAKIAIGIPEVQSVFAEATGFSSKKTITHFFLEVKRLRDRLAHGHDLITGTTWERLFRLSSHLEKAVQRCEELL